MNILIAGATGNLGCFVVRHLAGRHRLRLLLHKRSLAADLSALPHVSSFYGDLSDPRTLAGVCDGTDCVIHLAGVLFAPRPERFLPDTNVGFVRNLLSVSQAARVKKFILISFPHVEGETTPEHPATDRQDVVPGVVHFKTRLDAEKLVITAGNAGFICPVILRCGVVYGKGVKLIEAARRLARYRFLAVWKTPTWVHLVALPDFLAAVEAAIEKENIRGLYNVCDDSPLMLQDFLDQLARHFGYPRPWRLPDWMFRLAAGTVESLASMLGTGAPLTGDIVKAGMTSSVADTSRTKRDLLPALQYPSLKDGLRLL